MSRIVLLNGEFVPFAAARLPIMDRGFLFADGIYEVSAVLQRRTIDNAAHLARLDRSLKAIDITNPYSMEQWISFQKELIARNALREGLVYIQVTRGVAERDFAYSADLKPNVVMFTQTKAILDSPLAVTGAAVVTVPDLRWARRDIKSVSLLPQVLAKQAAARAGGQEAWMVDEDGLITEGASSSAFMVTREGLLLTRPLTRKVLPGVTRLSLMTLVAETDLNVEERAFSVEEALAASEAFFTSASALVMPVVSLDGAPIGSGKPGPIVTRLRKIYIQMALAEGTND